MRCAAGLDRLRRALLGARAKKKLWDGTADTQAAKARIHGDVYAGLIKGAPFFLAV